MSLATLPLFFGKGKMCSDDRVVAEMLKDLPMPFYDLLAEAFLLRLKNHSGSLRTSEISSEV